MKRNDRVIDPQTKLTQEVYDGAYKDVLRTTFLCRIARLELAAVVKSRIISKEMKDVMVATVAALQSFNQKTMALCEPCKASWLTTELSKEKLFDIGNLVECAAQVNGEQYETVFAMGVEMIDLLVSAAERGVKLDVNKLGALARLWRNEIRAAEHLKTSLVSYDASEDSLTLKVHTDGERNRQG